MKYRYVAIEREYGSAGTEIGKKLASVSQIPCYGIEILERVAEKLGINVTQIEQYEEAATSSFLYSVSLMGRVYDYTDTEKYLSNEDRIYWEEQCVIKSIVSQGPAIFVGRCAVDAVAGRDDVLKVFIQADKDLRKKRAVENYGISPNDAEAVIRKFDKKRGNYYLANTGKKWRDMANYHLILDSGKLGIEQCSKIIWEAMNQ